MKSHHPSLQAHLRLIFRVCPAARSAVPDVLNDVGQHLPASPAAWEVCSPSDGDLKNEREKTSYQRLT